MPRTRIINSNESKMKNVYMKKCHDNTLDSKTNLKAKLKSININYKNEKEMYDFLSIIVDENQLYKKREEEINKREELIISISKDPLVKKELLKRNSNNNIEIENEEDNEDEEENNIKGSRVSIGIFEIINKDDNIVEEKLI